MPSKRWSERPPASRPSFIWPKPFYFQPHALPVAVAQLFLVRRMEPFLALAALPPTPFQFLTGSLAIAIVVLQVTLLFLAVRLYRAHSTAAFRYLLWACLCYVVPELAVFVTGFFPAFLFHTHVHPPQWFYILVQICLIPFLVLFISAIRCFIRNRGAVAKPNV
jgi:hypothetical protein